MSKRIIKIERNNISLSRDDNRCTKSGTNQTYASRQSEDSTTEDEVEFEGWIEFVSKKDTKNNTDRNSVSTKRESKSRSVSRKNTYNRTTNSKSGTTSQRNNEYSSSSSKKLLRDREEDTDDAATIKGDIKSKKSSTVHAQIHAQVHKSTPSSTYNPTSAHLQNSSINQTQVSTQAQSPTQIQIPSPTQIQIPSQIQTQANSQTQMQMPLRNAVSTVSPNETQVTVSVPSAMQTLTSSTQGQIEVPMQTSPPVQYVQAQPVTAAPNTVMQPVQQQIVNTVPTPLPQQQVQVQQILQPTPTVTPQIQVQHMQQPIQQHIQSPVQQVHQVHQVQQVQQVHQQTQHPIPSHIQVVNANMMPNFRQSNGTGAILMDSMPSTVVNVEHSPQPVYIRQPPPVFVANKPGPPIIINPPPANVIFENPSPPPIYVNNPKPNIIMKNGTSSLCPNSGIDTLAMTSTGGTFAIDSLPPPVCVQHRGGTGTVARASLDPNGNATVIDNKNIYLVEKNANGAATIVQNDFMHTGHGFDPRSPHSASTVLIPNMGHIQHIPYPKQIHMQAQPHSCLQRMCSCLDPSTSYINDSSGVARNIIDMGFLPNIQHIDYPQDIRLGHHHQCVPPTIVPIGGNHHPFAHVAQQPQMIHMNTIGQPQIIEAHESNPHIFYENNFVPQVNEVMMSNGAMQFPMSMPTMQPMYMVPQVQTTPHMMNTGNCCIKPMMAPPDFRSPNIQLQANNIQRMNSIPPGCTLSNMGCSQRNNYTNRSKINYNRPRKVEITAKPMGMRAATNPIYR